MRRLVASAKVDIGSATCSKVAQRVTTVKFTCILRINIRERQAATPPNPGRLLLPELANIYAFSVEATFGWPP